MKSVRKYAVKLSVIYYSVICSDGIRKNYETSRTQYLALRLRYERCPT